ncbi:MAG: rod shape-determining protein RodA [Actinobacteria bacterium]|nr:MAG: rod shape-determining protein RodA [Actinomycetota bacterium]
MATAVAPRGGSITVRRNPAAPWRHLDIALFVSTVALAGIGLLMVYSATLHKQKAAGLDPQAFLKKQALWVLLGLGAMLVAMVVDYRVFRDFAPVIFLGTLLVLLVVLSPFGSSSKGTQAWFQLGGYELEPSEYAKVALVVCLAAYCAQHRGDLDLARLGTVLLLAGVPMGLIYLQPDLGTALVFVAVLLGMLLVAGARPRHLAALALLGTVGVVAVIQLGVLKQYQLDRLGAFLDPQNDTARAAYNLHQSVTTIASGGVTGKGLFKGSQTNLSFVPEQHTDFIFTVVGEELGLVGAFLLLALFALVVWRTWRIAALAKDPFGTLLCVGVLSMLLFQIFENVGMTMGIMPITGIPLPFLSYGGSAMIASFFAIGLVLNVHMRRFS